MGYGGMGESWLGIAVNITFAAFMAVATGFAMLFATNVRTGFAKSEKDIGALYEKREADLAQFHAARMADMERMLRELYEHKLEDAKALADCASRDSLHALRNESGNQVNALRGEFSASMTTVRDDLRHGIADIKGELAQRRRANDKGTIT